MSGTKGNTNALKHGLYAKHFTPQERLGLQKMNPQDNTHQVYVLDVVIGDLFEQHILERDRVKMLRQQGQPVDLETLTRIDNSLALAITALNGAKRTHALLNGTVATSNDTFDEALNSLAIFKQAPYLIESKAEDALEEVRVEESEQAQ
jgi:hypothetical protein